MLLKRGRIIVQLARTHVSMDHTHTQKHKHTTRQQHYKIQTSLSDIYQYIHAYQTFAFFLILEPHLERRFLTGQTNTEQILNINPFI